MMAFSFLMCSERSGSNFIVSLLNGHPAISGPPPTHLFRLFVSNRASYGDLSDDENWNALVDDVVLNFDRKLGVWNTTIDVAELRSQASIRSVAGLLRHIYQREAVHDGASNVFVKENHTSRIAAFLLAGFSECRFVWLVRDPRDVAASWLSTRSIPGGVERAVEVWLDDQRENLALEEQLMDQDRVIRVRYEDLLSGPDASLRKLTRFLDLPYDEVMLEAHSDVRTRANATRIDGWANLARPVMRSNSGKFRTVLSESECEFVELSCRSMMVAIGYHPEIAVEATEEDFRLNRLDELRPSLREGEYQVPSASEREIRRLRLAAIERVLKRKERR